MAQQSFTVNVCAHVWYSELAYPSRIQQRDWCVRCGEEPDGEQE